MNSSRSDMTGVINTIIYDKYLNYLRYGNITKKLCGVYEKGRKVEKVVMKQVLVHKHFYFMMMSFDLLFFYKNIFFDMF